MSSLTISQLRQKSHTVEYLPQSARELIAHYCALRIQDTTAICPYHINCGLRGKHRALVGKGRPEEIERMAEHYLSKFQMHANGDADQLRRYLSACGLGVDCSGFAAWVLDCMTQEKLQKRIWECLTFPGLKRQVISRLRPLENISANLLTGPRNTLPVDDLQAIRPGDLIRLIHGGHVMVIAEVGFDNAGQACYFAYVQSSTSYGTQNGVDTNTVLIRKPLYPLRGQSWNDVSMYQALKESGDDARIVRLRALV